MSMSVGPQAVVVPAALVPLCLSRHADARCKKDTGVASINGQRDTGVRAAAAQMRG